MYLLSWIGCVYRATVLVVAIMVCLCLGGEYSHAGSSEVALGNQSLFQRLFKFKSSFNQGTFLRVDNYIKKNFGVDNWLRFRHFNDPDWTYDAAYDYLVNENFEEHPMNIIDRAGWNARAPRNPLDSIEGVDGLVIHHTLSPANTTVKSIQNYHMNSNGWDDIGYHYIIARDENLNWVVHEGRPEDRLGAHAGRGRSGENLNYGKIGISMVGNFAKRTSGNPAGWGSDQPEWQRQPERQMVKELGILVDRLMTKYPGINAIYTHRTPPIEINKNGGACPGQGALHLVEAMIERYQVASLDLASFGIAH